VNPRRRRQAWIAVGALAALNAVVLFVYTLPRRMEERSLAERVASLRSEVESERSTVARLRRRTDALQANAADAGRFYGGLGSRSSLLSVLEELQRVPRELRLKVSQRSYEPEPVRGLPLTRYTITMPVSGTYRQLTAFLDRMERSPHFMTVDQVNLRKRGTGGEAELDVVLSAYVRAEGKGDGHGR